jgi:hypothetical protein
MNPKSRVFRKYVGVLSAVCGALMMSLPLFPQVAKAQQPRPQKPTSKVNPCPGIFYEEPYNNRGVVPQGCPANAFTQQLLDQGLITPSPDQMRLGIGGEAPGRIDSSVLNPNPQIFQEAPYNRSQQALITPRTLPLPSVPSRPATQLPLPRQQQAPIATILPTNNLVNVRLNNESGARITYQVIGDTALRSLTGKSSTTLQGLRTPITVTFYREDGGLLTVTPQRSSQPGTLVVNLRETTEVVRDRGVVRIEENGSVFLN